jgi:monofunctional glycosyltransferase
MAVLRWAWRVLAVAAIAVLLVQFWFLVHIWYWTSHNPESTAFMRTRLKVLRQADPAMRLRHEWVPYQRISPHLKRAVISSEDAKFLDHDGFDWDAIQKAYDKNVKRGHVVSGGSTISQQLAKNLFLSGDRAWWRKAQEAAITVMLETS